ncbi:hypothetical protein [Escherichia coli]|uniref:hypothetical protein n=1 Tax=Escherichia coli TaxID=562 RepID=UPI001802D2AA|nr:hypothetical protein [Escherichia coli]EFB2660464.1 hypothetical protein [Escherichia coli]EKR5592194.1 hypothetical protein [Escherichia coli]MCQ8864596.1 hypothetical protein [Escherichia coli]HDJ8854949.1 hypothetical protein [Escherichia coli]
MTPTELLESVKTRFNPLLVREEDTLKAFLIKALTTYQDRAGVVKTLKLEKAGGTAIPLPEDYLSLVHVTDSNGLLVYSDELSGFIELELTGSERWPFRMLYLVNLRDRKLDEWQVPPAIIGMLEEYLEALINVRNVARQRRASIDGKFDYSDLPDETTLYARVQEIEEKMSSNRAIIPGATIF